MLATLDWPVKVRLLIYYIFFYAGGEYGLDARITFDRQPGYMVAAVQYMLHDPWSLVRHPVDVQDVMSHRCVIPAIHKQCTNHSKHITPIFTQYPNYILLTFFVNYPPTVNLIWACNMPSVALAYEKIFPLRAIVWQRPLIQITPDAHSGIRYLT